MNGTGEPLSAYQVHLLNHLGQKKEKNDLKKDRKRKLKGHRKENGCENGEVSEVVQKEIVPSNGVKRSKKSKTRVIDEKVIQEDSDSSELEFSEPERKPVTTKKSKKKGLEFTSTPVLAPIVKPSKKKTPELAPSEASKKAPEPVATKKSKKKVPELATMVVVKKAPELALNDSRLAPMEVNMTSSVQLGKAYLESLIVPLSINEFLRGFWEKRPLIVERNSPSYFSRLDLSSTSLDAMLRKNHLRFTKNVDITSYTNDERKTHNPPGRAMPAEVWDFYNEGCSVRWLNPQTFNQRVWKFCATLQEYLGCFVGANVYLTPPNSQGFAPHYDDIEAFILQLEGRKHWKLYKSSKQSDILPRKSSGNFQADSIGNPFLEVTLNPGDLLYFPRGTIHQAVATDSHSLHVTLSCYQHNTWADLLEQALPAALSKAISEDPMLRTGLPIGHLDHVGSVHSNGTSPKRESFMARAKDMLERVLANVSVDDAVDAMGKTFMQDSLPPFLSDGEKRVTMHDDGDRLKSGRVVNPWSWDSDTMVRLTRARGQHLVVEDGRHRLYYTSDNTREYHEEEAGFFEITEEMVDSVRMLVRGYPEFVSVASLGLATLEQNIEFAAELWQKGIVMTNVPMGEDGPK